MRFQHATCFQENAFDSPQEVWEKILRGLIIISGSRGKRTEL